MEIKKLDAIKMEKTKLYYCEYISKTVQMMELDVFKYKLETNGIPFYYGGNSHFQDWANGEIDFLKGCESESEIIDLLAENGLSEKYEIRMLSGCYQRGYVYIVYKKGDISENEINYFREIHFGLADELDDENGQFYVVPSYIGKEKTRVCEYLGFVPEDTEIYSFEGYERKPRKICL